MTQSSHTESDKIKEKNCDSPLKNNRKEIIQNMV